jgi:hypothetical protein
MAEAPLELLRKARQNVVTTRRVLSSNLAGVVHKDVTAQWEKRFIETQAIIQALDAAIEDEIKMQGSDVSSAAAEAPGH